MKGEETQLLKLLVEGVNEPALMKGNISKMKEKASF
jgi:hypothetical protein